MIEDITINKQHFPFMIPFFKLADAAGSVRCPFIPTNETT